MVILEDLVRSAREWGIYARTASLVIFPDGERAVHVSECELATLLQVKDGSRVGPWKMAALIATVSKDGKLIVCGCSDGKLRISDAEGQKPTIETNDRQAGKISALDVSTDSSTVASGSSDGSVVIWSVTTGQRLAGSLNLVCTRVSFVEFSSSGERLAVGCTNVSARHGAVYIMDIHKNQLTQRVVVKFNSCLTAISWLSDAASGQQRIFAGLDGSLAVIDPLQGTYSHKPIPGFCTIARNGKFIVSGGWQDCVRFWDVATFTEIGPSLPSSLPLAISPNNRLVTEASQNGNRHSLFTWNLSDILPKSYIISGDESSASPSTPPQVLGSWGGEAIESFNAVLSNIQLSPNPEVHRKYQVYASPSQREVAETIISDVLKQRPPVLIDTQTGHLCHGPLRLLTLEVDPTYRNLLSLIGEQDQDNFRRGVEIFFEYVMFSHKWDEACGEPMFHYILGKSVYTDLEPSPTNEKLRRFCEMVRENGYRWAWSDTCCIDRTDSSVLDRAIVSMYRWYKESVLTLAILTSVVSPSKRGDLRRSIWMTRAWTLQELLAPRAILFYDSEWKPYLDDPHRNHKDSPVINAELASAVSVSPNTLSTFHPSDLGVREKLRLASMRIATREEDIAYSLFGIFASDLQPHYGEGKSALGRLLEEIVRRSGDVTVFAWTGQSSQFNSCLPAEIAVYKEPPRTVSSSDANKLRTQAVELQSVFPRQVAMTIYGRIANLPDASFVNRRLHLPCIVFAVDRLTLVIDNPRCRCYRASVSVLGDVKIMTADPLPLRQPRTLLLVHPWIRELRDPLASFSSDDDARAMLLIARLGQGFSALLLHQQSYHGYRRVAADHQIHVQLRSITSSEDICTDVLQVWNDLAGLL